MTAFRRDNTIAYATSGVTPLGFAIHDIPDQLPQVAKAMVFVCQSKWRSRRRLQSQGLVWSSANIVSGDRGIGSLLASISHAFNNMILL
jgi:hypothetical protein